MQILISQLLALSLLFGQSCQTNKGLNNTSIENKTETTTTLKEVQSDKKDTYPIVEYTQENDLGEYATAIFAGGCFWCTEAAFERIEGVVDVLSGYSGGHKAYPTYKGVGAGSTGHTEAIYIYYDKSVVSYETLLDVLFVAHDPTTLNRQGPDVGEEYRSAIYFQTESEQEIVDLKIKALNASGTFKDKIVTEVAEYEEFWVAEAYHQNFYELNPNQGYVRQVSRPKVIKVVKTFPDLIKKKYRSKS